MVKLKSKVNVTIVAYLMTIVTVPLLMSSSIEMRTKRRRRLFIALVLESYPLMSLKRMNYLFKVILISITLVTITTNSIPTLKLSNCLKRPNV